MKIKELLTEGPLDYVKGFYKGGRAGAQAASQQAAGQKQLDQFSDQVFQKWNTYTGETGDKDVVGWARKFFKTPTITYAPADDKPASVKLFFTRLSQDYKAGKLRPQQSGSTASPQQGTPTNVPGFTVLDQEPIRIEYKKKDYVLNSQGDWVALSARGTRAPLIKDINPTLEKLLDKAAGYDKL
jgi:hypothetical protein